MELNYESELSDVLLDELERMYNVKKSVVIDYLYLRYSIAYYEKIQDISNKEKYLVEFLIIELNLPCYNDCFKYKGVQINRGYSIENSLSNIVANWLLQSSFRKIKNEEDMNVKHDTWIERRWVNTLNYGKNKASKFKGMDYYIEYFKLNCLMFLNNQYASNPVVPKEVQYIDYPSHHHFFVRTLEELYSAYANAMMYSVTHTKTITEKDLEIYLIKHLDLIEEGLKYINHQVSIKNGRIDILARDKNNVFVIIELKVQEDKELIWQCAYYPKAFMDKEKIANVRMMTIANDYPEHILRAIESLGYVEVIKFKPYVKNGKIERIDILNIKNES